MAIERLLLSQFHKATAKGDENQADHALRLLRRLRDAEAQGYVQPPIEALALEEGEDTIFRDGDFVHYRAENRVMMGGVEIRLTTRENALLTELDLRPGHPVARSYLESKIWGEQEHYSVDSNFVAVTISRLKRKFAPDHEKGIERIQVVRGIGYRYTPESLRSTQQGLPE